MTTHTHKMKAIAMALVLLMTTLHSRLGAQSDTLHLHYLGTQIQLHDTSVAKIANWAKSLNGKHVDIEVLAYFHKSEFKKFASQRADELFLELNRKARSLITITFIGPRKGADSQRSMVDVVYRPSVSPEEAAAAKARTEAQEAAEKKKKEEEKMAEKESKKKERESAEKKDESLSKKEKSEGKKQKKSEEKTKVSPEEERTAAVREEKNREDSQSKTKSRRKSKNKDQEEPVTIKRTEELLHSVLKYKPEISGKGYPGTKQSGVGIKLKQSQLPKIKNARIIVPLTDMPSIDSVLFMAVKKFWTYNPNIECGTMSYGEAKALAKKDKNVLVLSVNRVKSKSRASKNPGLGTYGLGNALNEPIGFNQEISYIKVGRGLCLMLENHKGKVSLASYLPNSSSDYSFIAGALAFGVSHMNSLASNLEKQNLKNNNRINKPFAQNTPVLQTKTLLLPDFALHKKLDVRDIPAHYEGKYDVTDYLSFSKAIWEKQDYAYVMLVPISISGSYIYFHYLMDASTGEVLYISHPKAAVNISGKNVSAANSGYINAKNLKYYNAALQLKEYKDSANEDKQVHEKPKKEKKEKSKGGDKDRK
jgi:hypothetical protein